MDLNQRTTTSTHEDVRSIRQLTDPLPAFIKPKKVHFQIFSGCATVRYTLPVNICIRKGVFLFTGLTLELTIRGGESHFCIFQKALLFLADFC